MFGKKKIKMSRAKKGNDKVDIEINGRSLGRQPGRKYKKPLADRILDPLEKKGRKIAPKKLMLFIVALSVIIYIFQYAVDMSPKAGQISFIELFSFDRAKILHGQIWRIVTFVFIPPMGNVFFAALELYVAYFIGTALENRMGSFRFDVYYLFGVLCCIIAGFILGTTSVSYLNLSLFFAFAMFFPRQRFLLFFIIPVEVRFLAIADAIFMGLAFIFGGTAIRTLIFFSLLGFFIYFWIDLKYLVNKLTKKKR